MCNYKNRKHAIRIAVVMLLSLSMLVASVAAVFAAKSINPHSDDPYVPGSGSYSGGEFIIDDNWEGTVSIGAETDKYKNRDVAGVVDDVNSGKDVSISDIINRTHQTGDKTDPSKFPTTDGYDVNLDMYDRITDFYELKYYSHGEFKDVKPGEATIAVPETVGMRGNDLMIMVINPDTGEIFLVPPKKFNGALGLITVDLPCLGPYCVLHRIPIVVRNVDPDRYPNKELADIIRKMPYNKVIECKDFLKDTEAKDYEKLEVADGVTVNTEDYSAAIALSDVAVELSRTDFSYDLSARFKANLYRGNDKVDWERILKYAGVKYDKDDVKKDDRNLTKIDPVKLNKCFVYHIDAATREVSIIYEPTVCWSTFGDLRSDKEEKITKDDILYWDVDDIDDQNVKDRKLNTDEEKTSSILADEVYAAETVDETYNNDEDVCIVINGDKYVGMGPFLLFMPKKAPGFPWWILLIIAAVAAGGYYIYRRNKKEKDENKQTA